MKTPPFASCLLGFVILVAAVRGDDTVILRTLAGDVLAGARTIVADNQFGNVTVTAVAEGFGWEWKLCTSGPRTARVEDLAEACRLDVQETNGVLQLRVVRPEQDRNNHRSGLLRGFLSVVTLGTVSSHEGSVQSHLTLKVPAASAVDVKNRFGRVRVTGTRNAVAIDCRHGRVELSHIDGAVTARTSFASMRVEKIGPAQLTNQNGGIEANDIAGDLQATTSFGKLTVRAVRGGVVLKNQNGAIEATHVTGDVSAATSFANLRVEEIGGTADLKGQNGRVEAIGVTGEVKGTTSFGMLRVHRLGSNAELKNQNGAIEAGHVIGNLSAATSFAELRVEEIGGRADLNCRNGKIEATRVTGGVRASNSFGPLRVREIGGSVELEGQNSEIAAAGVSGDIRAQTSFARLHLDGHGRRFVARNQNGAVEIVARSPSVQHIEATATFAPIDLRLPDESKPLIRAMTKFGKVRSAFPVLHSDTMSDANFATDGTPLKVSLKGQNGDIRIQQIAAR